MSRHEMSEGFIKIIPMLLYLFALIFLVTGNIGAAIAHKPSPRVDAGAHHTCVILKDGTVRCWGYNGSGQLGDGSKINSRVPVEVYEIHTAKAIDAGYFHTCAVLDDGAIRCWGDNGSGRLGNASKVNSTIPVDVLGISDAIGIAAGGFHTCALLADGTVSCWGDNWYGQLGDSTMTYSLTPVDVPGITNAVDISAGGFHTCVLLNDGTSLCWGYGGDGQLGNGAWTNSFMPVNVSDINRASGIGADYYQSAACMLDGTILWWGNNKTAAPLLVPGVGSAVDIDLGYLHTCALLVDGTILCWGWNDRGQLGDGTTRYWVTYPVEVSGIDSALDIGLGFAHTCAVLTDESVICWGSNSYGQLGDGSTINSPKPVKVSGIGNQPPIADAGIDRTNECTSYEGAYVILDGSGSTDPDSTPGTNDNIISFEWYENYGLPSELFLGEGEVISAALGPGRHDITLVVTETDGLTDMDEVALVVQDTTPPEITLELVPVKQRRNKYDDKKVRFKALYSATDICDPNPVIITIIEVPPLPGDLELRNSHKVKIEIEEDEAEIKAPDPELLKEQIEALGGMEIMNGQIIDFKTHRNFKLKFSHLTLKIKAPTLSLHCTAIDADGNTGIESAQVQLSLIGEDDVEEEDDD